MMIPEYLIDISDSFSKNANADLALQMKKYMKDRYVFFGIKSPERKVHYREHWHKNGTFPIDECKSLVKWCWKAPQREYQYFAMETMGKTAKKTEKNAIEIYEYMIINKSWWDTVDYIASNLVGVYFIQYPEQIGRITEKWMASGNIWLQRTCILFQLKYKAKTNTYLLQKFISPLLDSTEFFIRKAIGWALREYSKTNAEFVVQFVHNHTLSGLSEREALKWLNAKKETN